MIVSTKKAIELLTAEEVVALPTETVYGLAGIISSEKALEKIFSTKKRPYFDPLIVHVTDQDQANKLVANWPESANLLTEAFWPGPFTLVLPKKDTVSSLITAELDTVAIRAPQHPVIREVIQAVGPVAAPSANPFTKTSPNTAKHVEEAFAGEVAVVDGGPCKVGIESTIISLKESSNEIWVELLRPGQITHSQILKVLSSTGKPVHFRKVNTGKSPGQMEKHYQPGKPLVLLDDMVTWTPQLNQEICSRLGLNADCQACEWQIKDRPATTVARRLYSEMRENSKDSDYVFLKLPPQINSEDWEAIYDRLNKACQLKITKLHGELAYISKK